MTNLILVQRYTLKGWKKVTADKIIEILEELKKDFENKCHTSTDASNIEALDMAITMLKKGCDLASENDDLKKQLAEMDEHIEMGKKEISHINECLSNARYENRNLKVQCDTYKECLSLVLRETVN